MDFDKPEVYGDTSITDGLVLRLEFSKNFGGGGAISGNVQKNAFLSDPALSLAMLITQSLTN